MDKKIISFKHVLKYLILSPLIEVVLKLLPYSFLKIWLLNILGANIDNSALVYNIRFEHYAYGSLKNLKIGKQVYIGQGVLIDLCDKVEIGDYTSVSADCIIITHSSPNNILNKLYPRKEFPVKIGKNSWIGSNAIIMANVGNQSIIGAGAVVIKPIPDNCVAVGVPAKVIKKNKSICLTGEISPL